MSKKSSPIHLSADEQIRLHMAMKGQHSPEAEVMEEPLTELNSELFFCKIAELLSSTDANLMLFSMTYGLCNTIKEADGSYISLMSVVHHKDAPEGRRAEFIFYRYTKGCNMERFSRFFEELTEDNFNDINAILAIYTDVTTQIIRDGPANLPVVSIDGIPIYKCEDATDHMCCVYIDQILDLYEEFCEDPDYAFMFNGPRLQFGPLCALIVDAITGQPQIYMFEYIDRRLKAPEEMDSPDDRYNYSLGGYPYIQRNSRRKQWNEVLLDDLSIGTLADVAECLNYAFREMFSLDDDDA